MQNKNTVAIATVFSFYDFGSQQECGNIDNTIILRGVFWQGSGAYQ